MADDLIVTDEALEDPLVLKRLLMDIIERLGDDVNANNVEAIRNIILASEGVKLTVKDNEITVTDRAKSLQFIGFAITEETPDDVTITLGRAESASELCPGYTFTYVNVSTWLIQDVNASRLFSVGRRVKFTAAGISIYGTVTAVDYNVTSTDDTTIVMAMEAGDQLQSVAYDVCLTTSAAAWAPIAQDPFSGRAIRDIATGTIGNQQCYIIIGDEGRCAVSFNSAVAWEILDLGTTRSLRSIAYHPIKQAFYIIASEVDDSVIYRTTDGRNFTTITQPWTLDSGDYLLTIAYGGYENLLGVTYYNDSSSDIDVFLTNDEFITHVARDGSFIQSIGDLVPLAMGDPAATNRICAVSPTRLQEFLGYSDTLLSTSYNPGITMTGLLKMYSLTASEDEQIMGFINGEVRALRVGGGTVYIDNVTFAAAIRGFVYSPLHDRLIAFGDTASLGYMSSSDIRTNDGWTYLTGGFDITTDLLCGVFNEVDSLFVIGASNGQIGRSSTGL